MKTSYILKFHFYFTSFLSFVQDSETQLAAAISDILKSDTSLAELLSPPSQEERNKKAKGRRTKTGGLYK